MIAPHATAIRTIFGSLFGIALVALALAAQPPSGTLFDETVKKRLGSQVPDGKWEREKFCPVESDVIAWRVLSSYGSMFVASEAVRLPEVCVHKGEAETLRFQKALEKKRLELNGAHIDLQAAAAAALESAIREAEDAGLSITPFDGSIAGGRTYGDTLMLWNSRFFPGLEYWIKRGRLTETAREEIARLDLEKKILKVLEWESQGMFFSTTRTRSILTSTAPPGTSQHLAMIAFDINEYWNRDVRRIMNGHGWFQTVIDDPGHFTYLGFREAELPGRGLIAISKGGQQYWIPNLLPPSPVARRPRN